MQKIRETLLIVWRPHADYLSLFFAHSPINFLSLSFFSVFSNFLHTFARFTIFNSAVLVLSYFIMLIFRARVPLTNSQLNQIIKCHSRVFSSEKNHETAVYCFQKLKSNAGKQTASSWQSQSSLNVSLFFAPFIVNFGSGGFGS